MLTHRGILTETMERLFGKWMPARMSCGLLDMYMASGVVNGFTAQPPASPREAAWPKPLTGTAT